MSPALAAEGCLSVPKRVSPKPAQAPEPNPTLRAASAAGAPHLAFEMWETTAPSPREVSKGAPSIRVLCEWVGYHKPKLSRLVSGHEFTRAESSLKAIQASAPAETPEGAETFTGREKAQRFERARL